LILTYQRRAVSKFDADWFGKIGIISREWGDENVGVHVHRPRTRCKIYRMLPEDFDTPEIWDKLRAKVEADDCVTVNGAKCPNCKMPLLNWARVWHKEKGNQPVKRRFCGYCGERL
jgi:hypothetical protein